MIIYEDKVPEYCQASQNFECKNSGKTLEELGEFYVSTLPLQTKKVCLCERCYLEHGLGKLDKDLGVKFERQDNGNWKLVQKQVNQQKLEKLEKKVKERFVAKVKSVIKRVPLVKTATDCYYCATDPKTPIYAKISLLMALVYFITPVDLFPDFFPVFGYGDDWAILSAMAKIFAGNITDSHRIAAKNFWDDK